LHDIAPANFAFTLLNIGAAASSGSLAAAFGSVVVTGTGSLLDIGLNPIYLGANGGTGSMTVSQGGSVHAATFNSSIQNSNRHWPHG